MTEEQRRALFALREALRLCDGAGVMLDLGDPADYGLQVEVIPTGEVLAIIGVTLSHSDIDFLLEEHPES